MSTFTAQRVTRAHTIHLSGSLQQVFPLFEPLGEKLWAHGWNPEMLYPSDGAAQVGTVFVTQHPGEPTKTWTIIAYEKLQTQAQVSYLNVLPDSHLSRIDVHCEQAGPQITAAHVTYTLTALAPQGNAYLDGFTQEHYQDYISSWETAITHFLLHEHTLSHPHAEDTSL